MNKRILFIIAAFAVVAIQSCKEEEDPCDSNPTYDSEIASIITANCNISGCHNSGSSNGDWTTFAGMDTVLNNGQFRSRVLVNKTMPPNGSLTDSQLEKIQCWADAGFPQN